MSFACQKTLKEINNCEYCRGEKKQDKSTGDKEIMCNNLSYHIVKFHKITHYIIDIL